MHDAAPNPTLLRRTKRFKRQGIGGHFSGIADVLTQTKFNKGTSSIYRLTYLSRSSFPAPSPPNPSLVLKVTGILSRGKCLLPAPWRTAREMEESQLVAEMQTGHLLEVVMFGIVFPVFIAGMMFVMSKRQAKRESTLVRDLELSRAQTATAAKRTRVTQAQREVGTFED